MKRKSTQKHTKNHIDYNGELRKRLRNKESRENQFKIYSLMIVE